jgi:hypothetical protein
MVPLLNAEAFTGHAAPEGTGRGRVRHRVGNERFGRLHSSGKVADQEQRIASPISAAVTAKLTS